MKYTVNSLNGLRRVTAGASGKNARRGAIGNVPVIRELVTDKEAQQMKIRMDGKEQRADGFVNVLNQYGTKHDTTEAYQYVGEVMPQPAELIRHYETNGLFAKIIDIPADECVKHGFELDGIKSENVKSRVFEMLDDLGIEEIFSTAIKWSRLFGGALAVMIVDDGKRLDEPVDWETVKGIEDIYVFESAYVTPDQASLYNCEPADANGKSGSKFMQPEFYDVTAVEFNFRVHESRCLVFRNGKLPMASSNSDYRFWGIPEYARIKRALRDTAISHGYATKMLEKSVQAIYGMRGLSEEVATEDGEQRVLKRLQIIDESRGLLNSIAIDADGESYDFRSFSYTGVADVINVSCNYLSALTSIPQTILFGRSPAGMNATGESDMENYYNFIEREQKTKLKKNLHTLVTLVLRCMVNAGKLKEIPRFSIDFNPLWSMSKAEEVALEKEKASVAQIKAQTLAAYVEMQAVDPTEVRKALADDGDFVVEDIITKKDLKNKPAEDKMNQMAQQGGGMPTEMGGQQPQQQMPMIAEKPAEAKKEPAEVKKAEPQKEEGKKEVAKDSDDSFHTEETLWVPDEAKSKLPVELYRRVRNFKELGGAVMQMQAVKQAIAMRTKAIDNMLLAFARLKESKHDAQEKHESLWSEDDRLIFNLTGQRPIGDDGEIVAAQADYDRAVEALARADKAVQLVLEATAVDTEVYPFPVEVKNPAMGVFNISTGTPEYEIDRLDKDGKRAFITMMTPAEYVGRCAKLFTIFKGEQDSLAREIDWISTIHVDQLERIMASGDKMPMPYLDETNGKQDGRHRAMAAYELGFDRIPVLFVYDDVHLHPINEPKETEIEVSEVVVEEVTNADDTEDANGMLHSEKDGKFVSKGQGEGSIAKPEKPKANEAPATAKKRSISSLQNDAVNSPEYTEKKNESMRLRNKVEALEEELERMPSKQPEADWDENTREFVEKFGKAYIPVNPKWSEVYRRVESTRNEHHEAVESATRVLLDAEPAPHQTDFQRPKDASGEYPGFKVGDTGTGLDTRSARLVEMSPKEYLERCAAMFNDRSEGGHETNLTMQVRQLDEDNVQKYADMMRNGEKFPTPWLDERSNGNGQEGRHRAAAAFEVGIDKIPVYLFEESEYEKERMADEAERYWDRKRNGFSGEDDELDAEAEEDLLEEYEEYLEPEQDNLNSEESEDGDGQVYRTYGRKDFERALEEAQSIIDEGEYEYYGLRVQEDDTETVGEKITHHSYNTPDNVDLGEELDGVSTIEANKFNISMMDNNGGYFGSVMYLVGGYESERGYDHGELVMKDPVCLAKYRINENGEIERISDSDPKQNKDENYDGVFFAGELDSHGKEVEEKPVNPNARKKKR